MTLDIDKVPVCPASFQTSNIFSILIGKYFFEKYNIIPKQLFPSKQMLIVSEV